MSRASRPRTKQASPAATERNANPADATVAPRKTRRWVLASALAVGATAVVGTQSRPTPSPTPSPTPPPTPAPTPPRTAPATTAASTHTAPLEVPMHELPRHTLTRAFTSASLRPGAVPMGHFMNVDHFHMSEPTFPPHPHAGFSAVTWMMPWSAGGFVNRDSRGDRSRIVPGALHWTLAGAGIVHEEIPEQPGVDCEGLQIFVKLPEPLELMPAASFHLAPDEVPRVDLPGGQVRVLVGGLDGASSPVPSHADTTMLHLDVVDGEVAVDVPGGVEAFALTLRGTGTLNGAAIRPDTAAALRPGRAVFAGHALGVLVAWSAPMTLRPIFAGSFCMFSAERLATARAAFAAGSMGRLEPSAVRWVR